MVNASKRSLLLVAAFVLIACAACVLQNDSDESLKSVQQTVKAPLASAYCHIKVEGTGNVPTETDYLPHLVQCENGGANLQALKAQAIAGRSVAYYAMATKGSICDGQSCQVYHCGKEPLPIHYQAVNETAGMYLSYDHMLTYAAYVAGDPNAAPPSCKGSSGSTEHWVTYNEGKTGANVTMTKLIWVPDKPVFGQNRGCMSQWSARCLENHNGYDYKKILQFFYGDDIGILTAPGDCVKPQKPELDAELVAAGSSAVSAGANTYNVCAGASFHFWFEIRNTGSKTWTDSSGTDVGSSIRLAVPEDKPDSLSGELRISVSDTSNHRVDPDGKDCHDTDGCRKVRFKAEPGIAARAPSQPTTVVTNWKLVDEGRKWFGPEISLTFHVVACDSGAGGGCGQDCGALTGGFAGNSSSAGGQAGERLVGDAGEDATADWLDGGDSSQGCACTLLSLKDPAHGWSWLLAVSVSLIVLFRRKTYGRE